MAGGADGGFTVLAGQSDLSGHGIVAELGNVRVQQPKSKAVPSPGPNAPLVVFPFEEERFADISSSQRIEWASDLKDKACCSLASEFSAKSCRQPVQVLSFEYGRVFTYLTSFAIVGAAPRCIALACSRTVSYEPLTEGTASSFMELWATCKEGDVAYSGFSAHGQLFKVLTGSDHFFNHAGLSIAAIMSHYGTFPTQTTRAGRFLMLFFGGVEVLLAAVGFFAAVGFLNQNSMAAEGWRNLIFSNFALALMIVFIVGQLSVGGHSRSKSVEGRIRNIVVLGTFRNRLKVVFVMLLVLFFVRIVNNSFFGTTSIIQAVASIFGWRSAWSFLLPLLLSNCILSLLGLVYGWDETVGWMPPCMLFFLVHFHVSLPVRMATWELAHGDNREILWKSVVMLAVDAAAHGCAQAYVAYTERSMQRARSKELELEPQEPRPSSTTPDPADARDARASAAPAARQQAAAAPVRGAGAMVGEGGGDGGEDITAAPGSDVRLSLGSSGDTPPAMEYLPAEPAEHTRYLGLQRMRALVTDSLIIKLLADLAAVIVHAGQLSAAPDYVRWCDVASKRGQMAWALSAMGVQVGVLAVGHWLLVMVAYRKMPDLYIHCFKRLRGSKKLGLFCLGIMIQFSLYFWPKCMSCGHPRSCLLYLQCRRDKVPPRAPSAVHTSMHAAWQRG